jgi:tocopherol O-methyltransferase
MIHPKYAPSSPEVALHYDELDTFYRSIWGDHFHHGLWLSGKESFEVAVRQLVDIVAAEADVRSGTEVCDVGAGYGGPARQMVQDYSARVTALTLSKTEHEYATSREPGRTNPRYVLGDWLHNDLPSESFDVVTAIESASHMPDKQRFFTEAFRVLRPGGRFVFCAWLAGEQPSPRQERYLLEPICREGRLPGLGTASEYCTWLEQAGFHLRNFEDLSSRVRRTWPIYLGRTARKVLSSPWHVRQMLGSGRTGFFGKTMLRLWLGYRLGIVRYGLFKVSRPAVPARKGI